MDRIASRLIAMAVSLVGSSERVQQVMKCSADEFRDYCSGEKAPTQEQTEELLALVVREQGELIAKNRKLLAELRGR